MYESAEDDSTDDELLDGGLFAFVHGGTNPEVILILEAIHGETEDYWQYGCVSSWSRSDAGPKFDDREAWSAETYNSVGQPEITVLLDLAAIIALSIATCDWVNPKASCHFVKRFCSSEPSGAGNSNQCMSQQGYSNVNS